jgi:hypothetical protein
MCPDTKIHYTQINIVFGTTVDKHTYVLKLRTTGIKLNTAALTSLCEIMQDKFKDNKYVASSPLYKL